MYSNVMLCGRIGKQPESRTFGDRTVWSFSVATSRSKKKPDGSWDDITDWHNCQLWGNLNQRANKGALVVLSGSLESYKSDDGSTRWTVQVRDLRVISTGVSNEAGAGLDEVKTVPMATTAAATAPILNTPKNDSDELPF